MPLIHVEQGKTIKERHSIMGMAASQVRLLQLTQRGNDVRCRLTHLSMQKMSLSNDMEKVTRKFQESLNAKTLKWSNNGGIDCIDLSYANLMQPRDAINNNTLHMITDLNGRVVVDGQYKRLAEIISPDGAPGDWEAHSSEILAELTGLDQADIEAADTYWNSYLENKEAYEALQLEKPDKSRFTKKSTLNLFKKLDNIDGNNWEQAYNNESVITSVLVPHVIEQIKENLKGYFLNDSQKFEDACDAVAERIPSDTDITVKSLFDQIEHAYKGQGGAMYTDHLGKEQMVWYDTSDPAYSEYQQNYSDWEARSEAAKETMESSLAAYNRLYTADVKSKINFYDDLFSSIAEKGWTCYENVSDQDYLNNMLQNGMFTITTVQRDMIPDGNNEYSYHNTYNTDIALNCKNIVQVSDTEYRDSALVEYEHEKSLIKNKETRIDTRMKDLETEQSAIKQMMESIKNVMNNNIEQHMNIFS